MTRPPAMHVTKAWSCTVRLVVDDQRALRRAATDLEMLLASVDAAASRFRADSALSVANARAGRPTAIPKILVHLVGAALDAAQVTDGAVDPTVGRQLEALGYDRDFAAIKDVPPARHPRRAEWREVRLDREVGLLTVPAGVALDLGATAKAFVADLAARSLHHRYDTPVLVELGGDLAVAGARPDGWLVSVAERENDPGQLVSLRYGGLTTSTTTIRRWQQGNRTVHHLLDPRTGAPADTCWRTASVYAETALAANTASTAAIVLGDRAQSWLDQRGIASRLVGVDGTVTTTGAWPTPPGAATAATAAPAAA
ncbi:MAG: FAD:protein transferase [Pseudonocardiales bacterium]|jgi:thiamine biosynthesis lipoprotein|nr:FAD:protein transferase [Pseudonocardiales bacterium]